MATPILHKNQFCTKKQVSPSRENTHEKCWSTISFLSEKILKTKKRKLLLKILYQNRLLKSHTCWINKYIYIYRCNKYMFDPNKYIIVNNNNNNSHFKRYIDCKIWKLCICVYMFPYDNGIDLLCTSQWFYLFVKNY